MSNQVTHITEPVVLDRTVQRLNDRVEEFIERFGEGVVDVITDVREAERDSEGKVIYSKHYDPYTGKLISETPVIKGIHKSVVKKDSSGRLVADFTIPWKVTDLVDGDSYVTNEYVNANFIQTQLAYDTFSTKTETQTAVSSCTAYTDTRVISLNEKIKIEKEALQTEIKTTASETKQEIHTEFSGKFYTKEEVDPMLEAKQGKLSEAELDAVHAMGKQNLSAAEIQILKGIAAGTDKDHQSVSKTQVDSWNSLKTPYNYIEADTGSGITITPGTYDPNTGITSIKISGSQNLKAGNGIEIGGDNSINVKLGTDGSLIFDTNKSLVVPFDGTTITQNSSGKWCVSGNVGKVKDVLYKIGIPEDVTGSPKSVVDALGNALLTIPRNVADLADHAAYKTYEETKEKLSNESDGFYKKADAEAWTKAYTYSKLDINNKIDAASIKHLKAADDTILIIDDTTTGDRYISATVDTYDVKEFGGLGKDTITGTPTKNEFYVNVDNKTVKIDSVDNKVYVPIDDTTIKYNVVTGKIYVDSSDVDYTQLINKPTINGVELVNDVTPKKLAMAGDNMTYSTDGKKLNAKNTVYTAGNGLSLSGTQFNLYAKTSNLYYNDGDGVLYKGFLENPYMKKSEVGTKIEVTFDSAYNLQSNLYNKFDEIISQSDKINLPLESMIMDAEFIETSEGKLLRITLSSGKIIDAPLSAMLGGLQNTIDRVDTIAAPATASKKKYPSEYAVSVAIAGKQNALPTPINNYYLHVNPTTGNLEWSKIDATNAVYYAEYGVTTIQELVQAYNDGKCILCEYNGQLFQLAAMEVVGSVADWVADFVSLGSYNNGDVFAEQGFYCDFGGWHIVAARNVQWKLTAGPGIKFDYSNPLAPIIYADGTASALVDDVKQSYDGINYKSVLNHGDKTAYVDMSGKQDKLSVGSNLWFSADGKTLNAKDTTYNAGTLINIDSNNRINATYNIASKGILGWMMPDGETILGNEETYDSEGNPTGTTKGVGVMSVPFANGGKGRGPLQHGIIIPDEKTVSVNKFGVLKALAAPNSLTFYTNDITFRDDEEKKIAYKATIPSSGATGECYVDVINHEFYVWDGFKWQLINSFQNSIAGTSYHMTTAATPAAGGYVVGSGDYLAYTPVALRAVPNPGYKFKQWSDGSTVNPYSTVITADMSMTATFEIAPYYVNVTAEPETGGIITGGGQYALGDTCTLTAVPTSKSATGGKSWYFDYWSDTTTTNPKSFTVSGSQAFIAVFNYKVGEGVVTQGQDTTLGYDYYDIPFSDAPIHNETLLIDIDGTKVVGTYLPDGSTGTQTGYSVEVEIDGVTFKGAPHKTSGAATTYSTFRFVCPLGSAPATKPTNIKVTSNYVF